jgi:hypothetical protein
MCWKIIKNWLFGEAPKDSIDMIEAYTILKAEFPKAKIYLTDARYRTILKEEMQEFLNLDDIDKREYVSDMYDCDDFSFALMGAISNPEWGDIAFGILFSKTPEGKHAINCFIDKNRQVWIIEPQNDAIFALPSTWTPYFVLM